MKTLICMLVDESASMAGKEQEVIDGYNSFLSQQTRIKDDSNLSLIKFNSYVNTVYSNVQLQTVPMLHRNSYRPVDMTALYDAIGDGITLIDRNKRSEDRAIIVIITDGEDISSQRYSKEQIVSMIADRRARGDWSFVYIGEKPEEFAVEMGISPQNAINFCHEKGNFEAASMACTNLRSNTLKSSDDLFHK